MKMKLRIISMMLVCTLTFSAVTAVKAQAFVISAGVAVTCIIAGLLVSAGLVFASTQDMQPVVDSFYDGMDSAKKIAIAGLQSQFDYYKHIGNNAYKAITGVPNDIWSYTRTFVNDNYDVGENVVTDTTTFTQQEFSDYITNNPIVWNGSSAPLFSELSLYLDGSLSTKFSIVPLTDGSVNFIQSAGNVTKKVYPSSDIHWEYSVHATQGYGIVYINAGGKNFVGSFTSAVFKYSDDYYSVVGSADIVDNSEYDWTNETTGTRDLVIPIEADADGNMQFDTNGLPAVDVNNYTDSLVGSTADTITQANTDGVKVDASTGEVADTSGLSSFLSDIMEMLQGKIGFGPLKNSLTRLTNFDSSSVTPPIIYINLHDIFKASTERFGSPVSPFDDEESVLFDFAFLNTFTFGGLPLLDYFKMIIGFGLIYMTLLYVWHKIVPKEVIQ